MNIRRIRLTKSETLDVTYKKDGDLVSFEGANIVHKDMKEALKRLVPHLVILTEQREARGDELDGLMELPNIQVTELSINDVKVMISGTRILESGYIIKIQSPRIDLENDVYPLCSILTEEIDNVKYEAEEYLGGKWGIRQQMIDFEDDPFTGIEAAEAPQVDSLSGKEEKTA